MRAALVISILFISQLATAGDAWLSVTGGFNTYKLGEAVEESNASREYQFDPGSLDSGFTARLESGIDISSRWSVGLAYEFGPLSTVGGSETTSIKADCHYHSLSIVPAWYLYSAEEFSFGVGAEIGFSFLTGSVNWDGPIYRDYTGDISAEGVVGNLKLMGEYAPTPRLRCIVQFGIREASFDDVTTGAITLNDYLVGEDKTIDFDGVFFRAGLKWFFPLSGDNGENHELL